MGMSSRRSGQVAGRELTVWVLTFLLKRTGVLNEHEVKELSIKLRDMKRSGYLVQTGPKYILTHKAHTLLSESAIWELQLPVPAKWDHRWRMVLFDIPADKRKRRDAFRIRLKELGLVLYQDSVWVHPYPLAKEVQKIADFYMLGECVSFAIADRLSGDKKLRSRFNL
jgi:phenylacetic acid degradation operon negative regulatory protein